MKNQIEIHPAILVDNLKEFLKQINKAGEYCNWVDIDIIDWERTSKKTILVQEALSVPDKIFMNFDLMMDYPSEAVKYLVQDKRVEIIILNYGQQENLQDLIEIIKDNGKKAGIALNPENEVAEIRNIIDILNHVQIYTVEPGKQSNPFLPDMLDKIDEIRKIGFSGTIGIDGGISRNTLDKVLEYPIDFLSVGSVLSQAKNPLAIYNELLNYINKSK